MARRGNEDDSFDAEEDGEDTAHDTPLNVLPMTHVHVNVTLLDSDKEQRPVEHWMWAVHVSPCDRNGQLLLMNLNGATQLTHRP